MIQRIQLSFQPKAYWINFIIVGRKVWFIGLLTLFGFSLLGMLIIQFFHEKSPWELFTQGEHLLYQLALGLIAGFFSARMALALINSKLFADQKANYYRIISTSIPLNNTTIVFLSLCAGIGEEIFFRAAIQPLWGIWITSILFVALHGYFSFKSYQISVYGSLMVLIIACFGYMFKHLGLLSVVVAHALFDIILFRAISTSQPGPGQQEELHLEKGHDFVDQKGRPQ